MASLGDILRTERERRRRTLSEAAAATRIKVQTIEALEKNDFSRIAAPIYGKGFIKLYAAYLGIDPKPLIEEYVRKASPVIPTLETAATAEEYHGPTETTVGKRDEDAGGSAGKAPWEATMAAFRTAAEGCADRLVTTVRSLKATSGGSTAVGSVGGRWKQVSLAAGVLLVLILLASAVSRCGRTTNRSAAAEAGARKSSSMELAEEPADQHLR